jgi:hypothetical protein
MAANTIVSAKCTSIRFGLAVRRSGKCMNFGGIL